jgi:4-oxalocrotonate tautomerase
MPTLTLKIAPPRSPEQYQALARALTALTADTLGKRPEVTAVMIDELPAERWYVGSRSVPGHTALLEISITAGTNTAAQKAAFIDAAFAELQRQLAPGEALEEASYVIVREVTASDWGYGGRTQLARQLDRQRGPGLNKAGAGGALGSSSHQR